MKKRNIAVVICSLSLLAVAAWNHLVSAGIEDPPASGTFASEALDARPATAGSKPGINYSTGFEPEEGFVPGYIGNSIQPVGCGGLSNPCWGTTDAADRSLIEGHIDNLHPGSGVQHLRLAYDPATRTNRPGFGIGVDARFPQAADLSPRAQAPSTVSMDIAISGPEGMNFRIQPQSPSAGLPVFNILFNESGGIYVFDGCTVPNGDWYFTGATWDTTGEYKRLEVATDPCNDNAEYYYDGMLIHTSCVGVPYFDNGRLEQLVIWGDNFPGSHMDIDNVVLTSLDECPNLCDEDTCNDGNACNGIETCNPATGCVPGTPLVCDDGDFCNGPEFCNPATGCVPGTAPCTENETCNEVTDQCIPSTIPTVSQWGLVVLTIVLLVAAKVQFGRRTSA